MKPQAILCDFDGVLAVTGEDNFNVWAEVLSEIDVPLDREEYFLLEGKSSPELLSLLLSKHNLSQDLAPALLNEKKTRYAAKNSFSFYPGVEDLVRIAKLHDLKIGVVSGGSEERLKMPQVMEVIAAFDVIVTAADSPRAKPWPDPYLMAANKLNLEPSACIVIENAPLGIDSALAAGMHCIAITSTLSKKHLFKANTIVDNLLEVLPIIEELFE